MCTGHMSESTHVDDIQGALLSMVLRSNSIEDNAAAACRTKCEHGTFCACLCFSALRDSMKMHALIKFIVQYLSSLTHNLCQVRVLEWLLALQWALLHYHQVPVPDRAGLQLRRWQVTNRTQRPERRALVNRVALLRYPEYQLRTALRSSRSFNDFHGDTGPFVG